MQRSKKILHCYERVVLIAVVSPPWQHTTVRIKAGNVPLCKPCTCWNPVVLLVTGFFFFFFFLTTLYTWSGYI